MLTVVAHKVILPFPQPLIGTFHGLLFCEQVVPPDPAMPGEFADEILPGPVQKLFHGRFMNRNIITEIPVPGRVVDNFAVPGINTVMPVQVKAPFHKNHISGTDLFFRFRFLRYGFLRVIIQK